MKLINFVYKHNTKMYLISAAFLVLVGIVLIFSQYFGLVTLADDKALDMLFYYNQTTFYEVLHSLSQSDRLAYKLIHVADYMFILGIYPLISMGLSRSIDQANKISFIIIIPLIAGLFDTLENVIMDIHLYAFPNELQLLGALSGSFTTIKFILFYASLVLLVVFGIMKLVKKISGENK